MLKAQAVQTALDSGLPPEVAELYRQLEPPYAGGEAPEIEVRDREAAAYLWQAGGYRCGISAYLVFFLLGDFVAHARRMRPRRFGSAWAFARSFDYTDRFIKQVTDSGRPRSGGLANPEVVRMLRRIQAAHDRIRVPHWMMVHFGFTLLEQLERDLDESDPLLRHHHLRYMAAVYRTMGLPFAADRERLVALCRGIECARVRWERCAGPYGRRLLFLGQLVGVPADPEQLAPLLPETVRPLFEGYSQTMRPGPGTRLAGGVLGGLLYPARRWRNPAPAGRPGWLYDDVTVAPAAAARPE
jgi:hypothetical protein